MGLTGFIAQIKKSIAPLPDDKWSTLYSVQGKWHHSNPLFFSKAENFDRNAAGVLADSGDQYMEYKWISYCREL